jgi:hypothetical protein
MPAWAGWHGAKVEDLPVDSCSIPEVAVAAFNGKTFAEHIASQRPFIVRGLGRNWSMREAWRRDSILRTHGDLRFKVGAIGYAGDLALDNFAPAQCAPWHPPHSWHLRARSARNDKGDTQEFPNAFAGNLGWEMPELSLREYVDYMEQPASQRDPNNILYVRPLGVTALHATPAIPECGP